MTTQPSTMCAAAAATAASSSAADLANQTEPDLELDALFHQVGLDPSVWPALRTRRATVFYRTALTHESFDPDNNYEFFRNIGDLSLQQSVVEFIVEEYPDLFCPDKKAIVTDLKKYLMQGNRFVDYGLKIGLDRRVRMDPLVPITSRIMLEVFEAFLGVTEWLLTQTLRSMAAAYRAVHDIVRFVLGRSGPIPLVFEELVDPKSILKNLMDKRRRYGDTIDYHETKVYDPIDHTYKHHQVVAMWNGQPNAPIGQGEHKEKVEAEKMAAKQALEFFRAKGVHYEIPAAYRSPFLVTRRSRPEFGRSFMELIQRLSTLTDLTASEYQVFQDAFTHYSVDAHHNYEVLETLGDNTVNKIVVWYLARRFPQINGPAGKEIATKLKILNVKGDSYAEFAEALGMTSFIAWDRDGRDPQGKPFKIQKILEDVFESLIGAIVLVMSRRGSIDGFTVCYELVERLMNQKPIRLDYDALQDPKTALKEIIDQRPELGHKLVYAQRVTADRSLVKQVILVGHADQQVLGVSDRFSAADVSSSVIKEAEMSAARNALKTLAKMHIFNHQSTKFEKFY